MSVETVPYAFYYYWLTEQSSIIAWEEAVTLLENLKGTFVSHRKAYPTPDDLDTALVEFQSENLDLGDKGYHTVIHFQVIRYSKKRLALAYDKTRDRLVQTEQEAEDIQTARVIALPKLFLMAVEARGGANHIGDQSAVARLKSIVRAVKGFQFHAKLASFPKDVHRAMRRWRMQRFTFEVWPYNPHPQTGGRKLSDLLEANNARALGSLKPNKGDVLNMSHNGIIEEIIQLSHNQYGKYGGQGETEDGYKASVQKAMPNEPKAVKLKVYVPTMEKTKHHIKAVAKVLVETYGQRKKDDDV